MYLHTWLCLVWSCLDTNTRIFAYCPPTYGTIMVTILLIYTHDMRFPFWHQRPHSNVSLDTKQLGRWLEWNSKMSIDSSLSQTNVCIIGNERTDINCQEDSALFEVVNVISLSWSKAPFWTPKIAALDFQNELGCFFILNSSVLELDIRIGCELI